MTLTYLSHAVEDVEFLASFPKLPTEELYAWLEEQRKYGEESNVRDLQSIYIRRALTEDGENIEHIEFIVDARYTRDGTVYIQGSGFVLNYSEYMRDAKAAIDSANR